jgi:hypothetical protein
VRRPIGGAELKGAARGRALAREARAGADLLAFHEVDVVLHFAVLPRVGRLASVCARWDAFAHLVWEACQYQYAITIQCEQNTVRLSHCCSLHADRIANTLLAIVAKSSPCKVLAKYNCISKTCQQKYLCSCCGHVIYILSPPLSQSSPFDQSRCWWVHVCDTQKNLSWFDLEHELRPRPGTERQRHVMNTVIRCLGFSDTSERRAQFGYSKPNWVQNCGHLVLNWES